MKYNDPQLVDRLASEYVLGTLQGAARRRFQHLLKYRRDIQHRVAFWEQNLAELTAATDPVTPPSSVWKGIHQRINNSDKVTNGGVGFWHVWSGLATLASVALVVMVAQLQTSQDRPQDQIAEVTQIDSSFIGLVGDNKQPLWVLSADLVTGQLSARAVNATAAGLDKAFELWVLPNEGAPQSVGLLPVNGGSITHTLPAGLSALLKESGGLAISIEPSGGSPTGLPTGEVIQTTNIWAL